MLCASVPEPATRTVPGPATSTNMTEGLLVAVPTRVVAAARSDSSLVTSAAASASLPSACPRAVILALAPSTLLSTGSTSVVTPVASIWLMTSGGTGLRVRQDQRGVGGEHGLRGQEPVVADVGVVGQRLRREGARGIDAHQLVLRAQRVHDLGDGPAQGHDTRGVGDDDGLAVGVRDGDR